MVWLTEEFLAHTRTLHSCFFEELKLQPSLNLLSRYKTDEAIYEIKSPYTPAKT